MLVLADGSSAAIIAGLLMTAVGGFWFAPATRIAPFRAFLLVGVRCIAAWHPVPGTWNVARRTS